MLVLHSGLLTHVTGMRLLRLCVIRNVEIVKSISMLIGSQVINQVLRNQS